MRLFPQTYLGSHPAFPAPPEETQHPSTAFIVSTGTIAALPLLVSGLFRRSKPLPFAFAAKFCAYGTVVNLALQTFARSKEERSAAQILSTQGIEKPPRVIVDRVDHLWDYDNRVLLGGISGVLIASRLRQPWQIHGWKRSLAGFAFGASAIINTHDVYTFISTSQAEHQAKTSQQNKYKEQLNSALRLKHQILTPLDQRPTISSVVGPIAMALRPFGSSSGSGKGSDSSNLSGGASGSAEAEGTQHPDSIVTLGPHLGQQLPGETEVLPIANTDYSWTSDTAIEDLEKHIGMLQQQRRRLAQEAELIWAWLSEKELDYYNTPTNYNDSTEKSLKLRYIETLGSVHTKTWLEATSCDWMIADSKKRIEQLRSAASNDGKVTWRAGCSDTASSTIPEYALRVLKLQDSQQKQMQEQLEQLKSQMAMSMLDPEFESREDNRVFDPVKQKMVTEKQFLLSAREQIEKAAKETKFTREALGRIIADGKKR